MQMADITRIDQNNIKSKDLRYQTEKDSYPNSNPLSIMSSMSNQLDDS